MRCSYLYIVYLRSQCRKQGCCRNVYINGDAAFQLSLSRLGLGFHITPVYRCITQRFKFPTTSMRCSYLYIVYLRSQCRKQGCCRNVYMNGYHRQLLIKLYI